MGGCSSPVGCTDTASRASPRGAGCDSGTLYKSSRRRDLSTVVHVRAYADLTDQTNLEIGGSYTRGHNELGSGFTTQLSGADATLRWRPLSRAIYRSLSARTELIWSRREQLPTLQRAFGGYASLDYGFAVDGSPARDTTGLNAPKMPPFRIDLDLLRNRSNQITSMRTS